jgi:exodeoxyribonuclease V beta subunit
MRPVAATPVQYHGPDRGPKPPAAKAQLAAFICREIHYLVGQGGFAWMGEGRDRALHFGDIAVLVRSQSEFALIEPLLKKSSIPYTYYRKPGLFHCRQAHWLSMMLRAVCQPSTCYHGQDGLVDSLFRHVAGPWPTAARCRRITTSQRLLERWNAYAQGRRWGVLFQSLMEASGLTWRHCMDNGWERAETNFQQLFDYLEAWRPIPKIWMWAAWWPCWTACASPAWQRYRRRHSPDRGRGRQGSDFDYACEQGFRVPSGFHRRGLTVRNDAGIQVYHTADPAHPEQGCRKVIDLTARHRQITSRKRK